VPRDRVPALRERVELLRLGVERAEVAPDVFAAPPLEREPAFAPDARVEPAADDFARVEVFRVPDGLRVLALRVDALRVDDAPELFRPPPARELPDDEPELALDSPSTDHLPDITRCAASATASAMIDPSLVALDITLLAAAVAESAASSPASRILRRAAGLALIAAAAAASPAASISLLIAALASLSTVSLPEDLDREVLEVLDFADFAIALSPSRARISL